MSLKHYSPYLKFNIMKMPNEIAGIAKNMGKKSLTNKLGRTNIYQSIGWFNQIVKVYA